MQKRRAGPNAGEGTGFVAVAVVVVVGDIGVGEGLQALRSVTAGLGYGVKIVFQLCF